MILVSLIGDFYSSITPILYEFRKEISKHIIISDDAKRDLKKVKGFITGEQEIKRLDDLDYETILIKLDEDNFDDINECFNRILTYTNDTRELYFNGTDGMSSIALLLGNKIIENGGYFISYDKYDNEYHLISKDKMQKVCIGENLKIKEHLKLKGIKIKSWTNSFELRNRKEEVLTFVKDLNRYKEFSLEYPNFCEIEYQDFIPIIDKLKTTNITSLKYFIEGGVFEEYIYHLIKDNLEFDEVMCSVSLEFKNDHNNEYDILMIKNNHLHTIECKFVNKLDTDKFIYKLDSVKDQIDDEGKGMLLVVGKGNCFTEGNFGRSDNLNIKIHYSPIFDEEDFLKKVREHFL